MAISDTQSDIYGAYLSHFVRALLGAPLPGVEMDLEEMTAATLGACDAKSYGTSQPSAIGSVLRRVDQLLGRDDVTEPVEGKPQAAGDPGFEVRIDPSGSAA